MFAIKNLLTLIGRNAIISLIVVSITFIVIVFLSNEIEHISDSVALNHRLKASLEQRIELFEILKHDRDIIGTNDVQIENAFAPSNNILGFINTLDGLATQNALTQVYRFETPTPSDLSAPFPISTISYSNSFEANISTFSTYLKEFEKLPYFTQIEGFSIASQGNLGWLGTSTISFRATLHTKTIQ